jgi:hypothetical protein
MTNKRMLDLLADHAEALNRCEDVAAFDTAVWLTHYNPVDNQAILPLLQLAQKVKLALAPTHPSHYFRHKLKQDLTQKAFDPMMGNSIGRFIWLLAAFIVSLIGIILIRLRWLKVLPSQSSETEVLTTAV